MSQQAEQEIRKRILDGRLQPGQRLNEVEIAHELDMSRGPLREAIERLTNEGLLGRVAYRGVFVPRYTLDELREIYEARTSIESFAARLAAERASPRQIEELGARLEVTVDQVALPTDPSTTGEDFHATIVRISGNTRLRRSAAEVSTLIRISRLSSARRSYRVEEAVGEHRDLLAAITEGHGRDAQELMVMHCRRSMESALASYNSGAE